jgi:hypothetical protein
MLLIFVSPLMRSPLAARPRSSRSTCKDDRWERYRCGYSLPFEGEAESDVRNSFLLLTDGELVLSGLSSTESSTINE